MPLFRPLRELDCTVSTCSPVVFEAHEQPAAVQMARRSKRRMYRASDTVSSLIRSGVGRARHDHQAADAEHS